MKTKPLTTPPNRILAKAFALAALAGLLAVGLGALNAKQTDQPMDPAQAHAEARLDAFLDEAPDAYFWTPELNKFMAQEIYPAMRQGRFADVDMERARQLQYCKPTNVLRTTDPGGMEYIITLDLARPNSPESKAVQHCDTLPADGAIVRFDDAHSPPALWHVH